MRWFLSVHRLPFTVYAYFRYAPWVSRDLCGSNLITYLPTLARLNRRSNQLPPFDAVESGQNVLVFQG